MDLHVLRQVGIPEPILQLALRRASGHTVDCRGPGQLGPRYTDLSFLDEQVEDPDSRPYTWDIPDDYRRF